jgi:hypothetical protein
MSQQYCAIFSKSYGISALYLSVESGINGFLLQSGHGNQKDHIFFKC